MKEWRGRDVVGTIKMWEPEWQTPYVADTDSIKSSEMLDDSESRATTPLLREEPEPVYVEAVFPPLKPILHWQKHGLQNNTFENFRNSNGYGT